MSIISFNICFFVELQTRAVLILVCLFVFLYKLISGSS